MNAGKPTQRVIVVVGAGRSGTSALARGIQALGAELGGRLKPGSRKNAKGFFEDQDFIGINYRLRDVLGIKRSGAGVSIVPEQALAGGAIEPIFDDAVALIGARFGRYPLWGFKAGGVLGLLPFWERVFEASGQQASYVLALRNPLSVARSRAKVSMRRGLQENSDLEFLARVVPYFRRAARQPLAVVDYDRLMDDAEGELRRVADQLDLPFDDRAQSGIKAFAEEFLSADLRHHRYEAHDLYDHPRVVPLAREAYLALRRLAVGEASLTDEGFWREWARIEQGHAAMAPILRHIDGLEAELRRARRGLGGVLGLASDLSRKWRDRRLEA